MVLQEIEACRTYASEFERLEGKQMFSHLDDYIVICHFNGPYFSCMYAYLNSLITMLF